MTVPNPHTGISPCVFGELFPSAVCGAGWKSKYLVGRIESKIRETNVDTDRAHDVPKVGVFSKGLISNIIRGESESVYPDNDMVWRTVDWFGRDSDDGRIGILP